MAARLLFRLERAFILLAHQPLYLYVGWFEQTSIVAWVAESAEFFGWNRGQIPNNIESRSRIFLFDSDSGCPIRSFYISHSYIGNSCWNGTISFQTFVETESSCCAPRFPLILTAEFHSLYVKESGSEILERSESEILESRESESDISPPTPQPW